MQLHPGRKHSRGTIRSLKMHQRTAQELIGLSHKTDKQLHAILHSEQERIEQERTAFSYPSGEPEAEKGSWREFTEDPEPLSLVARPERGR
jgi:hypothetical protein